MLFYSKATRGESATFLFLSQKKKTFLALSQSLTVLYVSIVGIYAVFSLLALRVI